MTYEELQERFPEMTPLQKAPSLSGSEILGATLHGRHDYDPDTGSYVATRWFTMLLPLIAMDSYRVAQAPNGGWFFLGRVPLRSSLKKWNLFFVLLLLAGAGGIYVYADYNRPESKAERRIAEADKLAEQGQAKEAAERYQKEFTGPRGALARERMAALGNALPDNAEEAAGALQVIVDLQRRGASPCGDAGKIGADYASRRGAADPAGVLMVLDVAAPLVTDQAKVFADRRNLLEKLVAQDPANAENVNRLAEICEEQGDVAKAEQLLLPLEAKLGGGDGAAVLGRLLAAKGENDRAYQLLKPFVDQKLDAFKGAEAAYRNSMTNAQAQIINKLQNKTAEGFDYAALEKAPAAQQDAMVMKYLEEQLAADPNCRKARQQMIKFRNVFPAVLDLGMVMLARAQKAEPAARQKDLEAAEALFLSVRDQASGSDIYQVKLAQVKYWLGKSADGKKIMDELLATKPGAAVVLEALRVLREVGVVDDARTLSEKAYQQETNQEMKYAFANFRALMFKDLDDQLEWLRKCDLLRPEIQADLAYGLGLKAQKEGRKDEAVTELRRSVSLYESLPESPATLNNAAISLMALYGLTGDAAEFRRAGDKMDRALALKPGDSILLENAINQVYSAIVRDAVGTGIDCAALGVSPSYDMLSFFYRDQTGFKASVEKLRSHAGMVKLRNYSEKLVLLAPKNISGYGTLKLLYYLHREEASMARLLEQVKAAQFDHESSLREWLDPKTQAKSASDHDFSLRESERLYDAVKTRRDATFAYAASRLAQRRLNGLAHGKTVDTAAALKLAEEAHAAAPSSGTSAALAEALIYRVHELLIAANADYAKEDKLTRRWFGAALLEIAIARSEPLKAKAMALPEMKRYCSLTAERLKMMPDSTDVVTVWLLMQTEPELGKTAWKDHRANKLLDLSAKVSAEMGPYSPSRAREEYFTLLLENQPEKAKAVWKKLKDAGYPVPDWSK